jgi:rhomboid family protein
MQHDESHLRLLIDIPSSNDYHRSRQRAPHDQGQSMIPIRDTTKTKTIPFVNYGLIIICAVVFLYELSLGTRADSFLWQYGIIPRHVSQVLFQGYFSPGPVMTLLTSMFLHGGIMHLVGNMLYLYIFGDNVEDRLGHGLYLVFYIASGFAAALTEVYFRQESMVPLIGASGAIAGVLGAYFILYPRARVLAVIPLFVFFPVIEISAFFFLGFWFLLQFLLGLMDTGVGQSAGVAWWAHAGGFVAGAIILPVLLLLRRITR